MSKDADCLYAFRVGYRNPLYKYELYAVCWESILGDSAFYIAPGAASDSAAVYFECAWRLERIILQFFCQ